MKSAKKGLPIFFTVIIALTLLEAATAIASRNLNFNYSYLSPIVFLIYTLTAYLIAKRTDRKTAIMYAALVGLFDATVGWSVSMLFGANVGESGVEVTAAIWVVTALFVVLIASLFGLLGAWLATKTYKIKSTNR